MRLTSAAIDLHQRLAAILVVAASLAPGCKQANVEELEEETRELRAELREVREDLRVQRREIRELRESLGGPAAGGEPTAETPGAADGGVPNLGDGGPPAPPPPQGNVKITIDSNPRGATVYLEDRVLGKTPLLYEHPPSSQQLLLRIERAGFRPRLMSIRPDEDAKISVQLAKQ